MGPHGLAAPAPDWSSCSQSEGVVDSGLANWLRGSGQGGPGPPFVLSSAAPRAPPPGPRLGGTLPPAFHRCAYPHPRAQAGATEELQAAAEDPTKWPLPGRPPFSPLSDHPTPNLLTHRRKNPQPETRPALGLTLDKPFQFCPLVPLPLLSPCLLGLVDKKNP